MRRFSVNDAFKAGAYLKVDKNVGDDIDWVSDSLLYSGVERRLMRFDSITFRYASLRHLLTRSIMNNGTAAVISSITVGSTLHLFDIYELTSGHVEGPTMYTTCTNLLTESGGAWPKSSIFEIHSSGVDLNKLVIGKPALEAGDANNGYISPSTLATCLTTAKKNGWSAFA